MDGERIAEIVIMCIVNLLCAVTFYGIGVWAQKRKDPMHFYSGTRVDPMTISDVRAYNQENGTMWKQYSIPYWLSVILAIGSIWFKAFSMVPVFLLVINSTAGVGWLVWRFSQISKKYTIS